MCSEPLGQPGSHVTQEVRGGSVEPIDPVREIQQLLDLPNLFVPVGRQDTGRIANGYPPDRQRKKVEMRFAHLKTYHHFERMRLRGLSGARDEFHVAHRVWPHR
jgi:hypothetical protein